MDNIYFWCWWAATVGICAWKIVEGLWKPQRMLEWPFLACAMWIYFYGYMAYDAKISLSEYLGNGITNIGQLMPLLCLVAILIGWYLGTQGKVRRRSEKRTYPYFRFWLAGLFFVIVGAVGGLWVRSALRSGNLNFQESSGYFYLLFYVGYPGLAIAIWALLNMERGAQKKYLWFVTIVGLAAFMAPHMMDARRGPLFPAVIVLLLVFPLALRRAPNRIIFIGGLMAAGLVMLLFLQVRAITYKGGTWGQAVQTLNLDNAIEGKGKQADDNEYINNCQLIGTIYQNGKYQYGTGHLSLLWHWIPRAIWKDKPALGEGYYSFDELFDDVESATGFRLLGTGAASGGVADTFVQYGALCPLFWFGISWGLAAVYVRARTGNSPRWLFCYVGFICASHWLVSQGFSAAFVPGSFFQVVPLVTFVLLDQGPKRRPVAVRARRGESLLQKPTQPTQSMQS